MKRIVAATDGSLSANRAVTFAAELARKFDAELTIVTAVEETADAEAYAAAEHATVGELLDARCHAVLKQASQIAWRAGATGVMTRDASGDPVRFILQVIEEIKADAVIVGRRGHGRLAGLVLGSVSQKLVSAAPCAVVVVP